MRAYEILPKHKTRTPPITLRHLNLEKEAERRHRAEENSRARLVPIMYGNARHRSERIELEKQRLELEQQKAETVNRPPASCALSPRL